jgi:hypothetical protein
LHLRWAWLGGLVQLIAEVLRVGRCCLVPQLRIEVVASPFAGDASTISVKGFWFEKPGAKAKAKATAI